MYTFYGWSRGHSRGSLQPVYHPVLALDFSFFVHSIIYLLLLRAGFQHFHILGSIRRYIYVYHSWPTFFVGYFLDFANSRLVTLRSPRHPRSVSHRHRVRVTKSATVVARTTTTGGFQQDGTGRPRTHATNRKQNQSE